MSAVMFQAKIADLDGDKQLIAHRLRKIADELDCESNPSFIGSELKDQDGFLVGCWKYQQVGV